MGAPRTALAVLQQVITNCNNNSNNNNNNNNNNTPQNTLLLLLLAQMQHLKAGIHGPGALGIQGKTDALHVALVAAKNVL